MEAWSVLRRSVTGGQELTVKWQWGSLWAANWCHCQLLCSSQSSVHCEPERMSPICSYKTLPKLYRNCILITSPRQIDLSIVGYLWIISDEVFFKNVSILAAALLEVHFNSWLLWKSFNKHLKIILSSDSMSKFYLISSFLYLVEARIGR